MWITIFIKKTNSRVILIVFIDDITIAGSDHSGIQATMQSTLLPRTSESYAIFWALRHLAPLQAYVYLRGSIF